MEMESPHWFKLSNYESLRNITLHQWYRQLQVRKVLYDHFYNGRDASHASIDFWMEQIRFNPSFSSKDLSLWIEIIKRCPVLPDYDYDTNSRTTVTSLQADLFYMLRNAKGLDKVWEECDEKLDSLQLDDDSDAYKAIDEIIYEACENSHEREQAFFHIMIDLYGTDEQLINDFRCWLLKARKKYNRPSPADSHTKTSTKKKKSFSEKDMRSWGNNRLIQYLDLKIVSAFEKNKMGNEELGEALFPDFSGESKGDRSRRTVKDRAVLLISDEMMKALASQLGIVA